MALRSRILAGTALGLLMAGAQPAATAYAAGAEGMAGETARANNGAMTVAQADDQEQKGKKENREEKTDKKAGEKKGQRASQAAGKSEPKADAKAQTKANADGQKGGNAKVKAGAEAKQNQAAPKKEAASSEKKSEAGREAGKQEQPKKPEAAEKAPATKPAQRAEKKEPAATVSAKDKPEAQDKAGKQEKQKAADKAPAGKQADRDVNRSPDADGKAPAKARAERNGKQGAGKTGAQERAKEDADASRKAEDENLPAKKTPAARAGGENGKNQGSNGRKAEQAARQGKSRPENAAPVLDSQKVQKGEGDRAKQARDAKNGKAPEGGERRRGGESGGKEEARTGPPPKSDKAAQRDLEIVKVESATAEEGKRIDREEWRKRERRDRREGARVVKEIGDRFVLEVNNRTIVQSSDQDRLQHEARDVYYEDLPRGRTREVIERRNGARVVTIRNRYGDIVRRSRIMPDGQEYVLVYASDRDDRRHNWKEWRDPGRDLPPMQLTIPVSEYILEAEQVQDPDAYYRFLEEPPVEPVEQLYSIDDVKYSARIRDKVRRIDLDTINFEFGAADISESEVDKLDSVASAMLRLLENNPAETFLIEGHTDAVGSDVSNLALSDERAASVASALTNVFDVPPENLVTQGYGEQYPKIDTQDRERENRRVAIRRITSLVSPVASAQ